MTKDEVISKLKTNKLSEKDKIDVFNWYLREMSPEVFLTTAGMEVKLSEQYVLTAKSPRAKQLLEHSIIKIKKKLGIK